MSFHFITHNLISELICFGMYGLPGSLPTYGENFTSTAPLEIYLLRKMVTCSIRILPAVCERKKHVYFCQKKLFYTSIDQDDFSDQHIFSPDQRDSNS